MRAFVVEQAGATPVLKDFEEPQAQNGQEVFTVLAAGLNPVDRFLTENTKPLPRVAGLEAIGSFADGRRMYVGQTVSPYGSIAERAVADTSSCIELPEDLSDNDALSLGVAGMAAWLPLSWKAKVQPGESVLILGATGVQGQIAVQAAKLLGAGHVVAAGRNQDILNDLRNKGADNIAVLDGNLKQVIKDAAPEGGYDVVIDSLFGEPFLALLDSGALTLRSRVVVLGGSASKETTLNYSQLQAAKGATVAGYSSFSVPADDKREAYLQMAQHVIDGKLVVATQSYPLEQVAEAWESQSKGPHVKITVTP